MSCEMAFLIGVAFLCMLAHSAKKKAAALASNPAVQAAVKNAAGKFLK
jgi:hypothetical protein